MSILAIDYGTKRIGLALAINHIITTLPALQNDDQLISRLKIIISQHNIEKIYVGISEGTFARQTQTFVSNLQAMLKLPIETVEEAVSTIEADEIFQNNKQKKKDYKRKIDSIAAAVILRRALNY
jgi:putative Holliday junction resolvase